MKRLLLPFLLSLASIAWSAQDLPWLFEPAGGTPTHLYWQTEPGHRYDLWESTDLVEWKQVDGFPKTADGHSMGHPLSEAPEGRGFFKIVPIDEQPPMVIAQYPAVDGFAVGRFADVFIELKEISGIDPASVRLTVGDGGPLAQGAPGLTITGNTIAYDSGDAALGGWGETVTASLSVTDTLGHTLIHNWTFSLEPEPQMAENIFVFGSPTAQRAGQRVAATPTAALAARLATGPIRMNEGDEWTLTEVEADRLIIAYTGETPPTFAAGAFLCNLTPAREDDIFYRKLLSISIDASAKRLTLLTEDVPLEQFINQGAVGLSGDSVVYEMEENGGIIRAAERTWEKNFGTIGPDLSGEVLWQSGGVTLRWSEARWQLTPVFTTSVEIKNFRLQRFQVNLHGGIRSALVPRFDYQDSASFAQTKDLAQARRVVFLGVVGVVPVWLNLNFTLAAAFNANASVEATFTGGVRHNLDLDFGCTYIRGGNPAVVWERNATASRQIVPFTYKIDGAADAEIKFTPRLDFRLNSLAGVFAAADPRFGFSGHATVVDGELLNAEWNLHSRADLTLGVSVLGVDDKSLPSTSFNLYSSEWMIFHSDEFAIIPAGPFQMGDSFWEGVGDRERPVHTVLVSAFYMGKYEVTKARWDVVRAWAVGRGYTDLWIGGGKAAGHPVHNVSWHDVVKWCNARSEREGLTPCYTVGGAVYRTGFSNDVICDWNVNGYRLPTEAEWEKAARGA